MLNVLLVLWLFYTHLAGQSIDPLLTWPVYAMWAVLGGCALALMRDRTPLDWPMIAGGLALLGSLAVNNVVPIWGERRFFTLLGYVATYYFLMACPFDLKMSGALACSGLIMSVVAMAGVSLGNSNVMAGFIYLTVPAAIGTDWRIGFKNTALVVGALGLMATGCQGALVAAFVAWLIYTRGYWLFIALLAIIAGALQFVWHPGSIANRIASWQQAWADMSWFGSGLGVASTYSGLEGQIFPHAHCLPLTVAAELGLPGLVALAWGVWRLVPRLTRGWQGATLAGLLVWSLIDEVVWFWGAGLVAVYLLSDVMRDEI